MLCRARKAAVSGELPVAAVAAMHPAVAAALAAHRCHLEWWAAETQTQVSQIHDRLLHMGALDENGDEAALGRAGLMPSLPICSPRAQFAALSTALPIATTALQSAGAGSVEASAGLLAVEPARLFRRVTPSSPSPSPSASPSPSPSRTPARSAPRGTGRADRRRAVLIRGGPRGDVYVDTVVHELPRSLEQYNDSVALPSPPLALLPPRPRPMRTAAVIERRDDNT